METSKPVHVVVLGAGFGGLTFAKEFRHPSVRITVVDRTNHHLFQPLLYQVATSGLAAPDIAQPIRSILAGRDDVTVLMDEVKSIDLPQRRVSLGGEELHYDFLVLALGGVTSYFGHPEWEQFAPGLKSLDDALRIRREVLLAFERAETTTDLERRRQWMTIVVVGGGPTGVELAGAFAELSRTVLVDDFRRIDPSQARVILIEGSPRILGHLPPELSRSAEEQLAALGVEIRTNCTVKAVRRHEVQVDGPAGPDTLHAQNIIWAAGVAAPPITRNLGVELDRAGRVKVLPDLSVPGHPEVFAIGDLAFVSDENGKPVPGVSPAAMQMAQHVVRVIDRELERGPAKSRPAFRYWDKGTMATIGRSAAVAKVGSFEFSGLLAWLAWLFIHLLFLVGFRNKAGVLLHWVYSYCTYKRGARIVFGLGEHRATAGPPASARA